MDTLILGDRMLGYTDAGQGAVPIVLIHGFCGDVRYWQEVIPVISTHTRVIAPDLRGHGTSSAYESPFTLEDLADDIAALLDHLHVERVQLWGHSLGGYTALAFAQRYPSRIAGLALIHSTSFADTEEGKANPDKGITAIRDNGLHSYVDGLIPKLFAPDHLHTMPKLIAETKEIGYGTDSGTAIHTMAAMRDRPDRTAVLHELTVPVLLVAGAADQIFPPERVFSLTKPSVHPILLPSAGHMSMLESPDALNQQLVDFLQKSGY